MLKVGRNTSLSTRAIFPSTRAFSGSSIRAVSRSSVRQAKNDASTIDSFKLPSQTSINEWEFKYDFMPKVAEPKIPPVSPEAVKQDIALNKKQQVEKELFNKELQQSVKVEANDSAVVHGGESVAAEPEDLGDRGSDPVDSSPVVQKPQAQKTANTHKYVQLSVNPEINNPSVVNLGNEDHVDHKTADVDHTSEILDAEGAKPEPPKATTPTAIKLLAVLGLGGVAGYFAFGSDKKA